MSLRVVIPCAGNGDRWEDFSGRPKHLAVLRGEPILHRSVRLLRDRVPDADIRVVVKDTTDDRYRIPGTKRATAKLNPANAQSDKLLSSSHLWAASTPTLVLFGDVYLSDAAADTMTAARDDWAVFARFGASTFTGCGHAELFAFRFNPDHRATIAGAAARCAELAAAGQLSEWSGGWQIFKVADGVPDTDLHSRDVGLRARDLPHGIAVDDWTDDLDTPEDWHRWCYRWAKADETTRNVGHG